VGLAVVKLVEDIFICGTEDASVHTIASFARGFFGVSESVFLSLPCYIDRSGVKGWAPLALDAGEEAAFRKAAKNVNELQSQPRLLVYRLIE